MSPHVPQPRPTGAVTLVTADPKVGGTATFHVESSDPDLFVHLKGVDGHGALVYQGWLRWFGADLTFRLDSPALDAAAGACSFSALLEDWSTYGINGKTTQIASCEFVVN